MLSLVMEGVLYFALVAACGALLFFVVTTVTPLGRRWREARKRQPVGTLARFVCPVHGPYRADEAARLPSGELGCPRCHKDRP